MRWLLAIAILAVGCEDPTTPSVSVEEGLAAWGVAAMEPAMLQAAVQLAACPGLPSAAPVEPEVMAVVAARAAADHFMPVECVAAAVSGAQVVLTLSSCHGPLGLLEVDGTVSVDYAAVDGGVAFAAVAAISSQGGQLDGSLAGDCSRGDYWGGTDSEGELAWTDAAGTRAALSGGWLSTPGALQAVMVASRVYFETPAGELLADLRIARWHDECPSARGDFESAIEVRDDGGHEVVLLFDGTPEATWTSWPAGTGSTGTVQLDCDREMEPDVQPGDFEVSIDDIYAGITLHMEADGRFYTDWWGREYCMGQASLEELQALADAINADDFLDRPPTPEPPTCMDESDSDLAIEVIRGPRAPDSNSVQAFECEWSEPTLGALMQAILAPIIRIRDAGACTCTDAHPAPPGGCP